MGKLWVKWDQWLIECESHHKCCEVSYFTLLGAFRCKILIFIQDEINTANVDSNSWNQAYLAYVVGGSAVAVVAFILLTVSKLDCIKFELL